MSATTSWFMWDSPSAWWTRTKPSAPTPCWKAWASSPKNLLRVARIRLHHEIPGRIPGRQNRARLGGGNPRALHAAMGADGDMRRADPYADALRDRRPAWGKRAIGTRA